MKEVGYQGQSSSRESRKKEKKERKKSGGAVDAFDMLLLAWAFCSAVSS